jgi:lipoate-protein ligase A
VSGPAPARGPADPDDLPTLPYDLDDDLLRGVREDGAPRCRVTGWRGTAVVIGRGGRQRLEIDRAAVAADRVPLYRRPGGGCAVVLDPGNLVVAVGLPLPGIGGITSAFGLISAWLARALDACGVADVRQRGVSDLALGDRKIGGSCIHRSRDLVYYATTLLVAPDLDLVERYLPHPPREPAYRAGRSHRDFMGALRDMGFAADPDTFRDALTAACADTLPRLWNDARPRGDANH